MQRPQLEIIAGLPEMWQPVYVKYKPFFEFAEHLAPLVNEMIKTPVAGPLFQVVGRMATAAANTHGALLTLVLNGYGHDAMKLARSLFEIELNIVRLQAHPEEVKDFVDYNLIHQKQLYDLLSDEQKTRVTQERYDEMMAAYNSVLLRLSSARDKTRPRNEWCCDSLYERAKQAGPDYIDLWGEPVTAIRPISRNLHAVSYLQ